MNTAFFLFQLSRNPIAQFIKFCFWETNMYASTRAKTYTRRASLFGFLLALNPRNTLAAISIRILCMEKLISVSTTFWQCCPTPPLPLLVFAIQRDEVRQLAGKSTASRRHYRGQDSIFIILEYQSIINVEKLQLWCTGAIMIFQTVLTTCQNTTIFALTCALFERTLSF